LIDIFLLISIILIAWFGWHLGVLKSFLLIFAVALLFLFVANDFQLSKKGTDFYLLIALVVLFIVIMAVFLRVVKFFHLSILDKVGGAVLSVYVWIGLSIDVLVPIIASTLDIPICIGTLVYKTAFCLSQFKIKPLGLVEAMCGILQSISYPG
jgi:hypothetical protein